MRSYQRNRKQFFFVLLTVGFLVGILYENIFARQYALSIGMFSDYFLQQYMQTEIVVEDYVWYIARLRILPFVIVCFLGCMKWKKVLVGICVSWTGFSLGMLAVSAVMQLGMKGMILCIVGLLPHMVFYAFAYMVLFWYLYGYPNVLWNVKKTVAIGLAFVMGVVLEGYVNPLFMKLVIKALW